MADIDYDKLAESITRAMTSASESQSAEAAAAANNQKIKDEIEARKKLIKDLESFNKSLRDETSLHRTLANALRGQSVEFKHVSKELQKLDEQIEETAKNTKDADRDNRLLELQKQRNMLVATANLGNFNVAVAKTAHVLTVSAIAGAKAIVTNLQDGGSDIRLASDLLSAGVDAAGGGAKSVGKLLETFGGVGLLGANKKIKALGLAATSAGIALEFIGDNASKLAKFGIEVLTKEVEKTVRAFNETSAAGALFVDGAGGMRAAALAAGLTTDQFANVIKNNSTLLAQSGLGVSEGAKLIGRAMKYGGETTQKELLKLGFSFEEQASLYAETAADMRRTIGGKLIPADLSEQTQRYAENLRLISAITGEDAKKKVAQVREQNNILAFQQQIAKLGPKQQSEINTAMAQMTEMEKKNLRERLMYNGIVRNTEGNIYESQLAGAQEKGEYIYRLLTTGQLTADAVAQANVQFGERIKRSGLAATDFGLAAYHVGGVIGEAGVGIGAALEQANLYTAENVAQGKINVKGQKTTGNEFTTNIVELSIQMQKLRTDFQELLTVPMQNFSSVAEDITKSLRDRLAELNLTKETLGKNTGEKVGTAAGSSVGLLAGGVVGSTVGKAIAGRAVGAAAGAALGTIVPGIGNAIGAVVGGMLGQYLGGKIGGMVGKSKDENVTAIPTPLPSESSVPAFGAANGGIIRGPRQILAGENPRFPYEAFVPLPDNKTIPVTIKMTSIAPQDEITQRPEFSSLIPKVIKNLINPLSMIKDVSQALAGKLSEMTSAGDQLNQRMIATDNLATANYVPSEDTKKMFQMAFGVANEPLITIMRDQIAVLEKQSEKFEKLLSIANDSKNINQQMLNNSY